MKVAVVTPTIGTLHLAKCLDSVQKQTYQDVVHYIYMDGEQTFENIKPYLTSKQLLRVYSKMRYSVILFIDPVEFFLLL